jgi:hypothetical protein
MHDIEPFYGWEKYYQTYKDPASPFFGRQPSGGFYSNTVYNYYIHPDWDEIGSPTLYLKLLFAEYQAGFAVMEFIGEWNDILHNDIMYLSRYVVDPLLNEGITRFALIGENLMNFHSGDDDYYQEWNENIENGWIACINFREHVKQEIEQANLDYYLILGGKLNEVKWRTLNPAQLLLHLENIVSRRLPA